MGALAFLLSLLAANGGPMADAPTVAHAAHAATGCPFELVLEQVGTTGLRAQLKNRSSRKQPYLHEPRLQPVELVIAGPGGKPVMPRDRRKTMKFDRTLYRHLYAELDPGAAAMLLTGDARAEGNADFLLAWGPFEFALPPGRYSAHAVFRSATDAWVDEDGKHGKVAGLWKGTIKSAPVELTLAK
jgi:hypothetical protein